MAIALFTRHQTVTSIVALLAEIWLILFTGALNLSSIRNEHRVRYKALNIVIAFVLVSGGVTSLGFNLWPQAKLGALTGNERARIAVVLKGTDDPWLVHLMCPPNDEKDCAVASQFIELFEENGWHVKNRAVEKTANRVRKTGLYFALHSTAQWTEMPPGYYLLKPAFDDLVPTDLVVEFGFPVHELGIYFGAGTAR